MKNNQLNMFDLKLKDSIKKDGPLALRIRPKKLEDFIGQEDIISPGKFLYRAIMGDKLTSVILWGPPGSGKTTLAKIISNSTKAFFEQVNAVTSGVSEIKKVIESAKNKRAMYELRTIVFIDEIHRFNKAQQDVLLPYVEDGTIILIGATTENPYYEVNSALISRSTVIKLNALKDSDIEEIIKRCLADEKNGLGVYNVSITDEALKHIITISDGDARQALNALEMAVLTTEKDKNGNIIIDLEIAQDCIQKKAAQYDKKGENHYDTISAFIKSMRGSDPDATLHYLARMLYAGEDPMFIIRRIIICASEDVGNADPQALCVAVSAANAIKMIGMPESRIILSQAAVYVACAPKSNASYIGIDKALEDVEKSKTGIIPYHLRNAAFSGANKLGYGTNYKYPHEFQNNFVKQQYLPDLLIGKKYYNPSNNGYEKKINEYFESLKKENK